MKTGFFGGTFNPVHMGHIRLADYLLRHYSLKEVWLSLSPQNPLKAVSHPGATDANRFEMLKLACKGHPGLKAWDGELDMPRPSYTYNVLNELKSEGITPVLIIGADNWLNFKKWYKADQILLNYEVIVYPRPGYDMKDISESENVKFALNAPQMSISSTEIRNNITENINRLPESVADYIKKHKLYGY